MMHLENTFGFYMFYLKIYIMKGNMINILKFKSNPAINKRL